MTFPNCLIVGAARSGTTFLTECIKQNPQVFMADDIKERLSLELYMQGIIEDWQPYLKCFPNDNEFKVVFEKNNRYLFLKNAPTIIKDIIGAPSLIFLLRNPIDRAYSHFCENVTFGRETRSFLESLDEERLSLRSLTINNGDMRYAYLERGLYMRQIDRYLSLFPIEKMRFIISEDFWKNPTETLSQLFNFLDVDHFNVDLSVKKNYAPKRKFPIAYNLYSKFRLLHHFTFLKKHWPRKAIWPSLEKHQREKAAEYFIPDVNRLSDFLGRDLISFWFNQASIK